MKIAPIVILFAFLQAAAAADVNTNGVIYSIPDGLSLFRQLNLQTDQFRGTNGERWTITVPKFSPSPASDQIETTGSIEKNEQELKRKVEYLKMAHLVHRFERKTLEDGATLLLLGHQILRTGSNLPPKGQTFSNVDFYIFWGNGYPQLTGNIEWPGELEPSLERCISHIQTMKREGSIGLTVKK